MHTDTFEVRLSVQVLTCVKADVAMTNESQRALLLRHEVKWIATPQQ